MKNKDAIGALEASSTGRFQRRGRKNLALSPAGPTSVAAAAVPSLPSQGRSCRQEAPRIETPPMQNAFPIVPDRLDYSRLESVKKFHFIGIGGVGMSGIAQMCLERGVAVSGSDMKESDATRRLTNRGAHIFKGHAASNIENDTEVVVVSSAIQQENPELTAAREHGLPIRKRAEVLGWLMAAKKGIAVAGAHGKTTTTSLTSWLLEQGGFDPTLIVGGEAKNNGNNVRFGQSEFLVAEADESDASFLYLPSKIAIITNIDDDHMDFYGSFDRLIEVFEKFINHVDPSGYVVVCTDNGPLRDLLPQIRVPTITYGLDFPADYSADEIDCKAGSSTFRLLVHGKPAGRFELGIPGRHNLQNALAAMAVSLTEGVQPAHVARGLASFKGVKRRYQFIGEKAGVRVFDDYAHHPTEIAATLASVRLSKPKRLVVLFQPHRYTRTELLAPHFAKSFRDADVVMLLPVYSAGETKRDGVSSDLIFQHMVKGHPYVIQVKGSENHQKLLPLIASQLESGDTVMTVGAGDVYKMGQMLLDFLEKN
ncbi:MAG: UDP-N-acetylmuramate--L-alanine ligase [Candidatus Wallbacteria bacterium]|nr:UDP-N-acetylmuramate--L-alanine ligase [Candidatus Wallbacteria bacterium]